MATFASTTFNTIRYAAARPTYPRALYNYVLQFHDGDHAITKAHWDTAVDLGCGTGQATVELNAFARVIGVDPSAKMVEGAKNYTESLGLPMRRFEFTQSPAEKLDFLPDRSVDLVISAQAAHWFDWQKLWPELARVVRRDGTVAFWGYSEFRFTHYPSLTPLIHQYAQGSDPANSIGPHWEQPGRSILDDHFLAVPRAADIVPGAFYDETRVYFSGDHHPNLPSPRPIIMRKKTSWEGLEGWLRSASALHTMQERYPEDLKRPDGDIVTRTLRMFKEEMERIDKETGPREKEKVQAVLPLTPMEKKEKELEEVHATDVEIEWPLSLVLVKRS